MEAEFVNTFVQKQKAMIDDLTAKVVMLDTRATIAETKIQKLAEAEALVEQLRKQINDLTIERENVKQQLLQVKKAVNKNAE